MSAWSLHSFCKRGNRFRKRRLHLVSTRNVWIKDTDRCLSCHPHFLFCPWPQVPWLRFPDPWEVPPPFFLRPKEILSRVPKRWQRNVFLGHTQSSIRELFYSIVIFYAEGNEKLCPLLQVIIISLEPIKKGCMGVCACLYLCSCIHIFEGGVGIRWSNLIDLSPIFRVIRSFSDCIF